LYITTTGRLEGGWNDGAIKTCIGAVVNDGLWHHAVLTVIDSGVVNLWLDDVSQATQTFGIGISTLFDLWVGKGHTGWPGQSGAAQWFNGVLDDVRLWGYVLSAAEITTLYHGGDVPLGQMFRCSMDDLSGKDVAGSLLSNATIINGPPTIVAGDPALGVIDPTTVTFAVPFADPGTVVKNCLIGFGPLGSETQRLIVVDVKPKKDLTADITFVDEAPDLFLAKPTTLLLHFDGTNGQTTTVDSSFSPTTVTMNNATLTTSFFHFGTASCNFNGVNTQVNATELDSEFFTQTDFTVDWWFRSTTTAAAIIASKISGGAANPWMIGVTGGQLTFWASSNGSTFDIASANQFYPFPADGVFHHFAFTWQLGYWRFFVDGVLVYAFYSPLIPYYSNAQIVLGTNGADWFNGQIDEFRFTKGLARWIATFVPPAVPGTP
jgi:hypothetical protein